MEIVNLPEGIKIFFTTPEAENLGLLQDEFYSDEINCKIFLGAMITMVVKLGLADFSGEVTAKMEKNGEGVVVTLVEHSKNIPKKSDKKLPQIHKITLGYIFFDSEKLCEFCKNTLKNYQPKIISSQLYLAEDTDNTYILTVSFSYAKSTLLSKKDLRINSKLDEVSLAKILEHSSLLCNAPLEKIYLVPPADR